MENLQIRHKMLLTEFRDMSSTKSQKQIQFQINETWLNQAQPVNNLHSTWNWNMESTR